jgi:hypothetical protein
MTTAAEHLVKSAPTILDALAHDLRMAKHQEDEWKERRIAAEAAIVEALGSVLKDEGSHTEKGDYYKVRVTTKWTRTVDGEALKHLRESGFPEPLIDQAIKMKPEVSLTGLRYLQNNEPEAYAALASCITAKPAKASVTVEALD